MVLGQLKTEDKSNEITVIPILLELLDVEGAIITIDAIGTQTDIAETIIEQKADYILALRGNQSYLQEDVKNQFKCQKIVSSDQTLEKNRGRIETRRCEVITDLIFLENTSKWKGLKSLIKITVTREINDKRTVEERYYISSLLEKAKAFNSYIC